MKSNELLEVIGEAQDDYILDANTPHKKTRPVWVKWAAMAACLCLIVVGGWRLSIAFLGNNMDDPFREGQLYEMSSLDDLPIVSAGGGYDTLPIPLSILKNLVLENATLELYYADGGDPYNTEDWYRLLINTSGDPTLMIVCVFNERNTYEDEKVDMVFTEEATKTIEINGTTVEYAPMPTSLNYTYWYYSIFEYENVIFDVRVQSDDADMIFTVLNRLLVTDSNGEAVSGGYTGDIDSTIASVAVFPDSEVLNNVDSATLTNIDQNTAYSFEKLGDYLPTYVKSGYQFSKASLYETVMKDGTVYYQLRVTYSNDTDTYDTYTVFVMNYHPGSEYTVYSGDALIDYINELPGNGVFLFALDDLYFGFVPNDLSSGDVMAVVESIFANRNTE